MITLIAQHLARLGTWGLPAPARGRPAVSLKRISAVPSRRTLVALCAAGLFATAGYSYVASARRADLGLRASEELVYYIVHPTDLPITVLERGTLASQREIKIACDVETVPGQVGTRILSLVPNGTAVKEGDLLVEFDSAPLRDRLNNQSVVYEQAKAAQIQADARYENQKTQNDTNLAAAQLKLQTSNLALEMYEDGNGGTHRIALADLDAKIQQAKNQIAEALAALKMKAATRKGVESLFKLGYRGKGDLDQAVHNHLQADFALVKATNDLAAAEASRKKLESYEHPIKLLELKGAIATAKRALDQVRRDNEAYLAQSKASKTAAERALVTEEDKLKKYQEQLSKCKVFAPHAGLVAHSPDRTPWGRFVADGELVTERFKILSLPDLTSMQVKTAIHESVLDQVKPGMTATVKIDAFQDANYTGTVRSVAVLPTQDGSMSSDVKLYEAIVVINEEAQHIKPGMTAIVEIHVNQLHDVLTVPVQAVVQVADQSWCYVQTDLGLLRRDVKLGEANEAFVQIADGLSGDDRVVLNPTAIVTPPAAADAEIDRQTSTVSVASRNSPAPVQ